MTLRLQKVMKIRTTKVCHLLIKRYAFVHLPKKVTCFPTDIKTLIGSIEKLGVACKLIVGRSVFTSQFRNLNWFCLFMKRLPICGLGQWYISVFSAGVVFDSFECSLCRFTVVVFFSNHYIHLPTSLVFKKWKLQANNLTFSKCNLPC